MFSALSRRTRSCGAATAAAAVAAVNAASVTTAERQVAVQGTATTVPVPAAVRHLYAAFQRANATTTAPLQLQQYCSPRFQQCFYSTTTSPIHSLTTSCGSRTLAQTSNSKISNCHSIPYQVRSLTTSSTPPSSATSGGGGFVAWYEGYLHTHPIPTKMVTGSFLWGIGDAVAQVVPHWAAGNPSPPSYDVPRSARAVLFGFALHAPLSHLHFNFLEYLTVRTGMTGIQIPFFKAFMEQFVYWSWFSNSLYHGAMGLMQGFTLQECYQRIADVLWETQKAQWVFWIPIQLINFQFTPVRHQLNVVLATSIVWTALLSAWYPPLDDVDAGKSEEEPSESAATE